MKSLQTKSLLLIFFLLSAITFAQNNITDEAKADYQKAITLFNSGDYDGYSNYVADNIECYTGVYTPLLWKGKTNWMDFINGLKNFNHASYEYRQPSFRNFGDNVVMCNAYFVFTTVDKNGVTEVQTGRQSAMLIKSDGIWKIASNHFSAMF